MTRPEQDALHSSPDADPVTEAYKKDIDRTTIRENLRRTPEERLLNLQALQRFAVELRRAGEGLRARR